MCGSSWRQVRHVEFIRVHSVGPCCNHPANVIVALSKLYFFLFERCLIYFICMLSVFFVSDFTARRIACKRGICYSFSVSVCLSVRHTADCVRMTERIELVFGTESIVGLCSVTRGYGYSENKDGFT